jgi:ABC-type Fe3+ transport system permease subunit
VNEWAGLPKAHFTNLSIASTKPYISLSLTPRHIHLRIAEDTAQSRGVFEKIRLILRKRRRTSLWIMHLWIWLIGLPISGTIFVYAVIEKMWIVSCIAVFAYLGFNIWYWGNWYHTIIIPKYRIEAPSFWKSNYNTIIISIFSAILGAFAKTLFDRLWKSTP